MTCLRSLQVCRCVTPFPRPSLGPGSGLACTGHCRGQAGACPVGCREGPRCVGERRLGARAVSQLLFLSVFSPCGEPSYCHCLLLPSSFLFSHLLPHPLLLFPPVSSFCTAFLDLLPWSPFRGGHGPGVCDLGSSDSSCFIFLSGAMAWGVTNRGFVSVSPQPPRSAVPPCVAPHPWPTHSSGKAHQSLRLPNTPHPRKSSRSRSSACLMTRLSLRSA